MRRSLSAKLIIRRGLQFLAASLGQHNRTGNSPRLLILMYHRILPVTDARILTEEPGMIVTPESLSLHLQVLREKFTFYKLSEWVDARNRGDELPDLACAVTFDDGWADNYEFGFPVLKQQSVPATVFLVSDMIGTHRIFWPNRLMRIVYTIATTDSRLWLHPALKWIRGLDDSHIDLNRTVSPELLTKLISSAKTLPDSDINTLLDKSEQELQLPCINRIPDLLNWQQISEMTESGLVEVGSHTCNHVRLDTRLPDSILESEVIHSKQAIEENTGKSVTTFCYPNGDYTAKAMEIVKANYSCAVTTQKGWNTSSDDTYLLRRVGIHEDITSDKTAFLARISGWL